MRVRVAVPNGLTPGQVFGVFTSSYKLRVTVPPGVTGGQLLYITFTPPPPTQKTEKEIIDISGDFISNEEEWEWKLNLEWVKKYIDKNKKRPSQRNKNKDVKTYGIWICNQVQNYQKKGYIMFDTIRKLWEDFINDDKYKNYFLTNEEEWKIKLEWVKKYINENKKRPSQKDKNENVKTHGMWINNQIQHYQKKQYIMTNETIRHLWEDFINEYKNYFK